MTYQTIIHPRKVHDTTVYEVTVPSLEARAQLISAARVAEPKSAALDYDTSKLTGKLLDLADHFGAHGLQPVDDPVIGFVATFPSERSAERFAKAAVEG